MSFAENIKSLREAHGYTQAELANLLGITQTAYAKYELSINIPTLYIAVKLARLLGTTCEELVSGKKGA